MYVILASIPQCIHCHHQDRLHKVQHCQPLVHGQAPVQIWCYPINNLDIYLHIFPVLHLNCWVLMAWNLPSESTYKNIFSTRPSSLTARQASKADSVIACFVFSEDRPRCSWNPWMLAWWQKNTIQVWNHNIKRLGDLQVLLKTTDACLVAVCQQDSRPEMGGTKMKTSKLNIAVC